MTVTESKDLKKGTHVYWQGNSDDSGIITETGWDAVTIAWNNGQVARVHHGDMRRFSKNRQSRILCEGGLNQARHGSPVHAVRIAMMHLMGTAR